jgi:hypothetical protein
MKKLNGKRGNSIQQNTNENFKIYNNIGDDKPQKLITIQDFY